MPMMDFQTQQSLQTEIPDPGQETDQRRIWRRRRSAMEWRYQKSKRYVLHRFMKYKLSDTLEYLFEGFLKVLGVYTRGLQNARSIAVKHLEIGFSNLPDAFDGYQILHLTDPHFDTLDDTDRLIAQRIENMEVDLCVMTGDYRRKTFGEYEQVLDPVKRVVDAVQAKDGILATLGNHDPHLLVDELEAMGITVLVNETVTLSKGNEQISFTGLDDPHNYYTLQANEALGAAETGFKIALVHSPEMFDVAERNGYHLYLCGHTHGGQICLPGAIPIIRHLRKGKQYARGNWQFGNMKGFTCQGCGVVGIPVRFNSQSELALITLKRKRSDYLHLGDA